MEKLVSIIIPTYKGAKYLARALKTVINQTYKNIEIIVVDDNGKGSIDQINTEKVINEISDDRVVYIAHENNKNGACARNTGLKIAKGNYIGFLDDDDLLLEDKIRDSVIFIENNHDYDGVYTNVACCDENLTITKVVKISNTGNCTKNLLLDEMFFGTGSNIFITRKAFKKIGFFDERFVRHQDLEYMLRYYRTFKTGNIDKIEIIKSKNGTNNIPKYEKLSKNEKLYCDEFSKEIDLLSEEEKKLFFDNQNRNLTVSRLTHSSISFRNLKDFIHLPSFSKINVIISKTKFDKTRLFKRMNSNRKKKIYSTIKSEIPEYIIAFLNKYGGKT